jgi:hemerythrin-like domain-containing protein
MTAHTAPPRTPDLTIYRAGHAAIRQGAHDLAAGAITLDAADRRRTEAFARYWRGYHGEVLGHHTVEDDFVLPAMSGRYPGSERVSARVDRDHHELDSLLDVITVAVATVRNGAAAPGLVHLMDELAGHMDEHLDFEDRELLPVIETTMSFEEYEAIEAEAIKAAGIGRQAAFTVPFILSYASAEERARMLAGAPMPLRVVYRLTRRSHARLAAVTFGESHEEVAA